MTDTQNICGQTSSGLCIIRNANVYAPKPLGMKNVLIGGGKILAMSNEPIDLPQSLMADEVDLEGQVLAPGFIDAHAHITGGGGEAGFATQVPPVPISQFTGVGVTTVVGLLGMTGIIIDDSIVLVTTIDEYAKGRGLFPAIVDGVSDRLRPVLLTTLTTVAGLGPRLWEGSQQARFLQPTVVTLCFGLLHGFGFAGALREIGLPQADLPAALLFFNVGVEAGQLLFIAAVFCIVALPFLRKWLTSKAAITTLSYGIGIVAVYWTLQRAWPLLAA